VPSAAASRAGDASEPLPALAQTVEALGDLAAVDVAALDDEALLTQASGLVAARKRLDAAELAALAELDDRGVTDAVVGLVTQGWLAAEAGLPRGKATRQLNLARGLAHHLVVAREAMAEGRIGLEHAAVLVAACNPRIAEPFAELVPALVDDAQVMTFERWRRHVGELVDLLDQDGPPPPDERVNRLSASRTLDGRVRLDATFGALEGTYVIQAIDARADDLFRRYRNDAELHMAIAVPDRATLRALALVELLRDGIAAGRPPTPGPVEVSPDGTRGSRAPQGRRAGPAGPVGDATTPDRGSSAGPDDSGPTGPIHDVRPAEGSRGWPDPSDPSEGGRRPRTTDEASQPPTSRADPASGATTRGATGSHPHRPDTPTPDGPAARPDPEHADGGSTGATERPPPPGGPSDPPPGGREPPDPAARSRSSRRRAGQADITLVVPADEPDLLRTPDGVTLRPDAVAHLRCDAAYRALVVDGTGEPLTLGRARRLATDAQRRALAVRDGACTFPGCTAPPTWCDAHHIVPFGTPGGDTVPENLTLLCRHHHLITHRPGWSLVRHADGRLTWTNPWGTELHGQRHGARRVSR
jgi:hypothetical protein